MGVLPAAIERSQGEIDLSDWSEGDPRSPFLTGGGLQYVHTEIDYERENTYWVGQALFEKPN